MDRNGIEGLSDFLREYPGMAIRPSRGSHTLLKGDFLFVGENEAAGIIQDSFKVEILVPPAFPKDLPKVTEIGERIPRDDDSFHVNQTDFSLCLGSPVGLLMNLSKAPTLAGFAERCLIPYLYAISHKLSNGGPLLFGELAHGTPGMLADYLNIFRLKNPYQVRDALRLLGMKSVVPTNCHALADVDAALERASSIGLYENFVRWRVELGFVRSLSVGHCLQSSDQSQSQRSPRCLLSPSSRQLPHQSSTRSAGGAVAI